MRPCKRARRYFFPNKDKHSWSFPYRFYSLSDPFEGPFLPKQFCDSVTHHHKAQGRVSKCSVQGHLCMTGKRHTSNWVLTISHCSFLALMKHFYFLLQGLVWLFCLRIFLLSLLKTQQNFVNKSSFWVSSQHYSLFLLE